MQRDVPRTLEGEEGPPGPRGSSGGQGPQGIQGIQGIQGPTGTSGTGISSGTNGAVQFSDGAGGFLDNSNIYIIDNSSALLPHNAMVFDSSSDLTGRPVSSLVLTPPSGLMPNASYNIREGTMGYFQIDGTDKRDFYGYDPSGAGSPHYQWQSLTKLTTPADPVGGAIQYNNAGAFDASNSLIFNTSVNPPQLLVTGVMNVTDTSGAHTSTIQCANASGIGGVEISSTSKCHISGVAQGPIYLETHNGDISCNITGGGNISFKTKQGGGGGISLDSGMAIDLSANDFIQLKQKTSNIMYATQTNETFLTMGESDLSNNFGIALNCTGTGGGNGVGVHTFIDVSGISVGQKGQATLQFNTDNDSAGPYSLGALPRIFIQSSAKGSAQGGYRALFAAGATSGVIPLPTNIGDGDVLKFGEFYVGQARMTGGEHFCFNLDSGSGSNFGNFNIAGGTHLCITDGSETKIFARLREDSGGKLELMNAAAVPLTTITLDGSNATIDCGASGGGIGIVNVRDNAGTILTQINGGDISANTIIATDITATDNILGARLNTTVQTASTTEGPNIPSGTEGIFVYDTSSSVINPRVWGASGCLFYYNTADNYTVGKYKQIRTGFIDSSSNSFDDLNFSPGPSSVDKLVPMKNNIIWDSSSTSFDSANNRFYITDVTTRTLMTIHLKLQIEWNHSGGGGADYNINLYSYLRKNALIDPTSSAGRIQNFSFLQYLFDGTFSSLTQWHDLGSITLVGGVPGVSGTDYIDFKSGDYFDIFCQKNGSVVSAGSKILRAVIKITWEALE